MKEILIANSSPDEAGEVAHYLQRFFQVSIITEPSQFDENNQEYDLLLIDHNFTVNAGIDFLMDILREKQLPVLMLTPADDPQCSIEALRVGAFNYLVKSGSYLQFLNIAISDAINKFNEKLDLNKTISDMKIQLHALEKKTGVKAPPLEMLKPAPATPAVNETPKIQEAEPEPETEIEPEPEPEPEKEINLMEEIVSRFKKGDVNLPTLPKISTQFNTLVKKGANLKEVAEFLKKDVAISSKLINVSNSALYRGMETNIRLEDAITRLGLGTTRQYVEIITNRSIYTSSHPRFLKLVEQLWRHSLACAYASEYIVEMLNLKVEHDIFSLGLSHDIGKLVLIQVMGELNIRGDYIETLDIKKVIQTLEAFHGKFGAVLLKRWRFPQIFLEVAMYHDKLDRVKNPGPEMLSVHFANLLVKSMGYNVGTVQAIDLENTKSGYLLRLRPEDIDDIKEKTKVYISGINKAI